MSLTRIAALAVSLVGVLAVPAVASAAVSGTYNLTVETTMTAPNCKWVGQGTVTPNGTSLSGSALLQLDVVSAPDPLCVALFPTLSGPLTGTAMGSAIDLMGTLGPFTAHFIGMTSDQGLSVTGKWTAMVGRLKVRGVFAAERAFALAPAMGGSVLATLVLVLFAVGAWSMRRTLQRT